MRSIAGGSDIAAVSDGGMVICPKCKRPKATPRDVIRWFSDTGHHGEVCWDGVDYPRLTPEEDVVPDAILLKESLVEVRKQRDWLACLAVAAVTK